MTLHLFEGYGIELEYMIVDRERLDVRPLADEVLKAVTGEYTSDYEDGPAAWSNELVAHVIEMKTNGPAPKLSPLPGVFAAQVRAINSILEGMNAMLMPTAMHPWMDPLTETKLWPHEHNVVYETYNRIFDCRGHGWSNLQSTHLNLPFANDEEFGRLHAAIRFLLPILPALAAASPIADGRFAPARDFRLVNYRSNSEKIPSATGKVIPEAIYTESDYRREILERIWADTAPYDPEGNLRGEFANARGAIARFDRMAIEIRILDIQECPLADIAVCAAISRVLQGLTEERMLPLARLMQWPVEPLVDLFRAVIVEGETAEIHDAAYLEAFGMRTSKASAGELWAHLIGRTFADSSEETKTLRPALDVILSEGTLASRIRRAVGEPLRRESLSEVYGELCSCLAENRMFRA